MTENSEPKEPNFWLRACEIDARLRQLRDDVDVLCGEVDATVSRPVAVWALGEVFIHLGRAVNRIKTARTSLGQYRDEEVLS